VWWLRLGIQIERIKPGHPQQNGRHERLHLTLKREATKPAAANVLQQQARFDDFIARYNTDRPHHPPGTRDESAGRPLHALTPRLSRSGDADVSLSRSDDPGDRLRPDLFPRAQVNLKVFAGQRVGVTQVGERIWLVTFMQYDLGYFDDETCRLEPIENPFGPNVLPLRSE
jgi:putative transposase